MLSYYGNRKNDMKILLLLIFFLLCSKDPLSGKSIQVPEDHKTIQIAINAADSGDVVEVAAGTYNERIALKPRITVRSVGKKEKGKLGLVRAERTIIDGGNEESHLPGVMMAEGATLDGFTVTRIGAYDAKRWDKHWAEQGENQSHDHIGKFGIPAIAIAGINCIIINNIVNHNGDTGIAIRGIEGKQCSPLVSGNICYRNMGGGIGSMQGSTAHIDNNICFENFYAGIGHNGASPLVTRNICYNNVRAGIGVSEFSNPLVRNNRCHGNRRAGIGIRTGTNTCPLIENNDCYNNEMAGIGAEDESAPIIRGNRCYRNKLAGIGCQNESSPLIVDNYCFENMAAGIGVDSAKPLLLRNRLERNKMAGIGIRGNSQARVIDNACIENRLVAVGIPDGSEVLLQNNKLVRTGGMPPIIAILGGSKVVLIKNTIRGGGVAGVLLEGKLNAIDNVIEGQNGGSGIMIRKDSKVILTANQISGYRNEVNDQGSSSIIRNNPRNE
ncbi:MAG TPA: DUF1565 domain-containing protein [Verrucomicrobia bacterium]|nr:DUF1565 domain-containing protein [Verrucomicrobiales bacterium]HIL54574.1 DUF1565 domain-containing protein [Verrucomicrobiota bacterium]